MSKKSLLEREKKRLYLKNKFFLKRLYLKKMIKNNNLKKEEKYKYYIELQKIPLNSNPCRMRNRCLITGRPRGYIGYFGVSRILIREKIMKCEIYGVTKSSW
ncbi:30S ribosomal protein S14 [Candidatus Vidania fulgoroideorum]